MNAQITVTARHGFEQQASDQIDTGKPYVITAELIDWDENTYSIRIDAPAGELTAENLTALLEHHIPVYTDHPRSITFITAEPSSPF